MFEFFVLWPHAEGKASDDVRSEVGQKSSANNEGRQIQISPVTNSSQCSWAASRCRKISRRLTPSNRADCSAVNHSAAAAQRSQCRRLAGTARRMIQVSRVSISIFLRLTRIVPHRLNRWLPRRGKPCTVPDIRQLTGIAIRLNSNYEAKHTSNHREMWFRFGVGAVKKRLCFGKDGYEQANQAFI